MPSTVKDESALPTSPKDAERSPEIAPGSADAQPVALEVPVTVNGARAVEGSEKREPFSETTSTVLVLANGAVIRLSSSVAPGQLLFLTNEKTKKEIVCQVVKSKNYRSVSGYVELEFTQPVLGFWGMRFPGERSTSQGSGSLPASRKADLSAKAADIPPKSVEATPVSFADTRPTAENFNANLADAVQEFKTEIKADSRSSSKADFLAPNAEPSIDGLKLEANRLQEQLSALLFAEQKQSEGKAVDAVVPPSKQELGDAAAKIFDMANEEPAPAIVKATPAKSEAITSVAATPKNAPAKSSFDDEEVKIPAWLEPLARNAAIPAPPAEESDLTRQFAESEVPETAEPVSAAKQTIAAPPIKGKTAAPAPKPAPAVAVFGNAILGGSAAEPARPRGSGKGIWMGVAAGLIVAAASGGWYFRDSLASLVAAHTEPKSTASPVAATPAELPPAPPVHSAALETPPATSASGPDTSSSASKSTSVRELAGTAAPISSSTQGKMQAAAITERIPKSNAGNDVTNTPAKSVEATEPEIKRPSLGKVRLAKPKVGHSAKVQANGEMEPSLEASSDALSAGEISLGPNFAEGSTQPAAPPAPAGGDVKPAHLISSVPPVYPALAKSQHVGGDVRVDAFIDATGRVTTMKVVSGHSLLQQAAMDALRQWKYQAATLDGKPVPMHLTVTIQFRLQ